MADFFDNDAIRSRIEYYMESNGLTASAFADKASISRSTLSNILSGKSQITFPTLNRIIETYPDCNPNWLLIGGEAAPEEGLFAENKEVKPLENRFFEKELQEYKEKARELSFEIDRLKKTISQMESVENKTIDKIMVFYNDNSFETYTINKK